MIYLIGGAPRVGKSIVAKKIAESTRATFISTDDVCGKVARELSEEQRKVKFPLSSFSGTASENTLTPEARVELQIISAKSLEPEFGRLISDAIGSGKSIAIEGVHLLPEYVRQLLTQYGVEKVRAVFVGLTDIDRVVEGIMNNTSPDNWMRDSDSDVIRQVAEFVVAFSVRIQEDAKQNHLLYEERTADFEGDVKQFYQQLIGGPEVKLPLK